MRVFVAGELFTMGSRKKIAIVAGEDSGDVLGAGLIRCLQSKDSNLEFFGICGPAMIGEGAAALHSIENLNAIGLEGLFGRLRKILHIRKQLIEHLIKVRPELYIGIDAPDFNLQVHKRLNEAGIPSIQYVAPTLWAWRSYRIRKIKKYVTKLLTVYPFESHLYEAAQVPFTYVGHPVADEIDGQPNLQYRCEMGFEDTDVLIALLPGSRLSEVKKLAPIFVDTALKLMQTDSRFKFATPAVNSDVATYLQNVLSAKAPQLPIVVQDRNSRNLIAAADIVLTASGTAALEAALSKKPVVVGYRVSLPTLILVKLMVKVKHYSILNHLGDHPVIPEFMQGDCNADNLLGEVLKLANNSDYRKQMLSNFEQFTDQLRLGANERAAQEVIKLLR